LFGHIYSSRVPLFYVNYWGASLSGLITQALVCVCECICAVVREVSQIRVSSSCVYAYVCVLKEASVIPENPVSILSGDVTGCEWVDSACIRFNKCLQHSVYLWD